MSIDAARTVLRLMIERLEPVVGTVSRADFSYWGGEAEYETFKRQRQEGGWLLFANALLDAREALASDDPAEIIAAALTCPAFERDGLKLAATQHFKAAADADTRKRRNGGLRRGAAIASAAQALWGPWEHEFEVSSAGRDYQGKLKAREAVKKKMLRAGFVEQRTGEFPTDKTIARHFPCKK